MSKIKYFDALESLAALCSRSVSLYCSPNRSSSLKELVCTVREAEEVLLQIESALFKDFMPPLERSSIAICAHSLWQVSDLCRVYASTDTPPDKICLSLVKLVEKEVLRLRNIKRSNEVPDTHIFRSMLTSSPSPRGAIHLRQELSKCLDTTVEVMLCNI